MVPVPLRRTPPLPQARYQAQYSLVNRLHVPLRPLFADPRLTDYDLLLRNLADLRDGKEVEVGWARHGRVWAPVCGLVLTGTHGTAGMLRGWEGACKPARVRRWPVLLARGVHLDFSPYPT